MKRSLLLALLLTGLAPGTTAHAQVFGQYTPAEILAVNTRLGGVYLDFSDSVVGGLGQLRLSFYPNVDFGFQGGLARLDLGSTTKTSLRLATDVRFGLAKASAGSPVDVVLGGGLGVETSDNYSVLRLGPSVVASRTFPFSSGSSIAPYAGAMLSFASVDTGDGSDSDFSVPVRLGAELRAIPGVRIAAELQLRIADDYNDHTAFSVGVNLPF